MPNGQPDLFKTPTEPDEKEVTKTTAANIEKAGDEVLQIVSNDSTSLKMKLTAFNEILNRRPLQPMVRQHQGYLYLPIRYHKRLAQQLYLGRTKEEVISFEQIFNEICVHFRLHYCHPITNEWLFVDGLGSSQIMQDKDTKVADFAFHKKPNALQTCLPKAKSEAYKNATSQLGAIFGGDLNRKVDADYDARTNTVKLLNQ